MLNTAVLLARALCALLLALCLLSGCSPAPLRSLSGRSLGRSPARSPRSLSCRSPAALCALSAFSPVALRLLPVPSRHNFPLRAKPGGWKLGFSPIDYRKSMGPVAGAAVHPASWRASCPCASKSTSRLLQWVFNRTARPAAPVRKLPPAVAASVECKSPAMRQQPDLERALHAHEFQSTSINQLQFNFNFNSTPLNPLNSNELKTIQSFNSIQCIDSI